MGHALLGHVSVIILQHGASWVDCMITFITIDDRICLLVPQSVGYICCTLASVSHRVTTRNTTSRMEMEVWRFLKTLVSFNL